jgi:hypothetical protein
MPLTVRKKIEREIPSQYKQEEDLRWDIPHGRGGDVYAALFLRCHGSMTVAAQDCTALQTRGMERVLRNLRVFAEYREGSLEAAVRSYTAKGVNDGVAGRTASFAGIQLSQEALYDQGTRIEYADPGLTQAAHAVDIVWPIRFYNPRARNPWKSCIDSRMLKAFYCEARQGILDTTAAGDDTDVLVTDAASTVACNLNWDLGALVLKRPAAGAAYSTLRKVGTKSVPLSVSDSLVLEIDEGTIYKRIAMLQTDDDVLSNARISELAAWVDKDSDAVWGRWSELRGETKARRSLETLPAGFNSMDWPQGLDVREANSFDLRLNVPSGAVAAEDRLFTTVEEIVFSPGIRAAATAQRRGKGKGR